MTAPRSDAPARLVLAPRAAGPQRTPLLTWLHRDPRYRAVVRDAGRGDGRAGFSDAVIIAVVAQGLLPGLFNLVQSWVDQQRTEVSIRLQVGDSEVELQVSGRTDPTKLLDQAQRALDPDRARRALDSDGAQRALESDRAQRALDRQGQAGDAADR
ncbi:effector-associated constant component EACC1 [Micromonospora rifamycinica]|uniref:Uncharacterized protein n=1 Tax=Micromonospora rifamycinica TaxID=291594 RepID=A0A120F6Z9_9ACTN|nr:hypothetical protein [Micromonospora rifamycinica]KWV29466.1 hypothetical protein AWV63_28380 [Micromonospora rifamycinica]SCG81149.1 hypothetical protein GA0070623_5522 [Micromonospora rifamycinica]